MVVGRHCRGQGPSLPPPFLSCSPLSLFLDLLFKSTPALILPGMIGGNPLLLRRSLLASSPQCPLNERSRWSRPPPLRSAGRRRGAGDAVHWDGHRAADRRLCAPAAGQWGGARAGRGRVQDVGHAQRGPRQRHGRVPRPLRDLRRRGLVGPAARAREGVRPGRLLHRLRQRPGIPVRDQLTRLHQPSDEAAYGPHTHARAHTVGHAAHTRWRERAKQRTGPTSPT